MQVTPASWIESGGSIILTGGGGAEDSRPADELLAALIRPEDRVLYLPVAMNGLTRSYDSCLAWLRSVLEPLGRHHITMWTDLAGQPSEAMREFAAVYIGGGNTFRLLGELRRHGFDSALRAYLSAGGVIYGGSAGAIILGQDIGTCTHLDTNSVGLDDLRGLGLTLGYSVWCHYSAGDAPLIREHIAVRGDPVVALSERAAVHVIAGRIEPIGAEPVYLFGEDGRRELTRA